MADWCSRRLSVASVGLNPSGHCMACLHMGRLRACFRLLLTIATASLGGSAIIRKGADLGAEMRARVSGGVAKSERARTEELKRDETGHDEIGSFSYRNGQSLARTASNQDAALLWSDLK